MIALLQRVTEARVEVAGQVKGQIGPGLLAFIGVRPDDNGARAARLLTRLLDYRIFGDSAGRMNRSVRDTGGGLLLVPQFTLAADTRSGNRPGFSTAAAPDQARALFDELLTLARSLHVGVAGGEFGAHMQIHLINDGPATFWLET